jgi:hypothetical protein
MTSCDPSPHAQRNSAAARFGFIATIRFRRYHDRVRIDRAGIQRMAFQIEFTRKEHNKLKIGDEKVQL